MTRIDSPDLPDAIARAQISARAALEAHLAQARQPELRPAFVMLDEAGAQAQADAIDRQLRLGVSPGALAGLAIGIKDLFDVQGQPTRAGARALRDAPAAAADAPAVARLRAAGAVLIGRTQMTEFAFSGVGINPHDGTPANAALRALDPLQPRVPGGSTSGGAVAVAGGAAWAALGSDTGGSLRIPAALHGLVGYKPTQALVPCAGTVPLAPSFDTVGAISRRVPDAIRLHNVLADQTVTPERRPLQGWRFGIARPILQDGLDSEVAAAFEATLQALSRAGAQLQELALPSLAQAAELQAGGGITAAESWRWHQPLLAQHAALYDPRVAARIRRGAAIDDAQLAALHALRQRWIAAMRLELAPVDLILSPTVPMLAPPLALLLHDDDAFFDVNARLLRNPSLVNLLDGCALSLPCHAPGRAPVGLMLWTHGGADARLLGAALAVEAALQTARAA